MAPVMSIPELLVFWTVPTVSCTSNLAGRLDPDYAEAPHRHTAGILVTLIHLGSD